MAQTSKGSDRRRHARIWMRRGGQLIIVKGLKGSTIPCKVLNTSKGGALLRVEEDAASVPNDFYLTIAGHPDKKIVCSVTRRGKKVLGVRFVEQASYEVRRTTSAPW